LPGSLAIALVFESVFLSVSMLQSYKRLDYTIEETINFFSDRDCCTILRYQYKFNKENEFKSIDLPILTTDGHQLGSVTLQKGTFTQGITTRVYYYPMA